MNLPKRLELSFLRVREVQFFPYTVLWCSRPSLSFIAREGFTSTRWRRQPASALTVTPCTVEYHLAVALPIRCHCSPGREAPEPQRLRILSSNSGRDLAIFLALWLRSCGSGGVA